MLISLFPTPFGHFQFLGSAGQKPNLILTLCHNMFDMFGDHCCCPVHIDNHTGDWEAKSSRGNRNHSVCARLSQNNDDETNNKKLK